MRSSTTGVSLLGVLVVGGCLGAPSWGPLAEGLQVVTDAAAATAAGRRPAASDPVAMLLDVCAVMLGLASAWLLLAVTACTWDVLVHGTTRPSGPSLLRPRVVRACVATCLGATVLAPAARAQSPPAHDGDRRHRVVPAAGPAAIGSPATDARLLEGLPVPDRTIGRMTSRTAEAAHAAGRDLRSPRLRERPRDEQRLEVREGDCLWSLTAGLLPRGTPVEDVATGWRRLYAANRAVIGDDPDLLRPGQSLRLPPELLDRTHSLSPSPDRRSP